MKKRKLLLSTLAAAVFATGAGALVACGDGLDLPDNGKQPTTPTDTTYTVTFVPGVGEKLTKIQGNSLTTDKDGKLKGTMPEAEKNENNENYEFKGWGLKDSKNIATITVNNFESYKFFENTYVYAVFKEKDDPTPPGPVVTDEYDITFVAGEGGTLSGETNVKTSDGIAAFPTPIPDDGWEFTCWKDADGDTVYTSTKFTKSTTVTAQFAEKEQPGPGPTLEETGYDLYVNGVLVKNLQQGTGGAPVAPDNLVWDYYAENVTLEAGDQVSFTVANANIVSMWAEKNTAIQGTTATQGVEVQGTTVTVSVGGTYSVSFTQWLDMKEANRCVAYIGPLGETPPGPGPIVSEGDGLYVNGEKIANLQPGTGGAPVAPDNLVWDYYAENITLEAGDQVTFQMEGVNIVSMWAEKNTAIQGTTAEQGVEVQGTTVTVSVGGTYSISFTQWQDMVAANRCVAYIGPLTGEDEPNPPTPPQPSESKFYLYGTVGGVEKWNTEAGYEFEEITPDANEDYLAKKYKVELELTVGDQVKIFKTNDQDHEWAFNNVEEGCLGEYIDWNNNLEAKKAGTFTFYLKLYNDGGDSVWIAFDGEDEPNPPTPTQGGTYKVGETGTAQTLTVKALTAEEENNGMLAQYWIDTVQFATGDKLYFAIDGNAITFEVESASSGVNTPAGTNNTYLEINRGGKFKIYIKKFADKWQIYAGREIDPSEITKTTETVIANNAYLVGNVADSDATWDNSGSKGFKLTARTDGKYEIIIDMTAGDNFKFYKTGASTSTKTWLGVVTTDGVSSYIALAGDNLSIKATGKFYFIVDFAKSDIFVSYSANGEPAAPSTEAPSYECFLRGVWDNSTDWGKGWGMTKNADGSYSIKVTVTNKLEFKVVDKNGGWNNTIDSNSPVKPTGTDNRILGAGTYIITFNNGKISVSNA